MLQSSMVINRKLNIAQIIETTNRSQYQMKSQYSERSSGARKSRGGGHPPWLKGKEIGLYYRDKAKEKDRVSPVTVKLNPEITRTITLAVNNAEEQYHNLYSNKARSLNTDNSLRNKYTHIDESHFKSKFLEIVSGDIQYNLEKAKLERSKLERDERTDNALLDEYKRKQDNCDYRSMMKCRSRLPAYKKREEILDLLRDNQVIVISGETGCGKTTQIAQFILDEEIERGNGSITKVICTEPRRISAISVAERVAAERAESLGKSVGFQIRLEKVPARDRGSILFCTTGVLLRTMQTDPALKGFSHIILDEIHERNIESDFIITLLKRVIPMRPDLKIILMSATLNAERFSKYYNDSPMIHIPGFTYPVEELYLEDILMIIPFNFPKYENGNTRHKQSQKNDFFSGNEVYLRRLTAEKRYPKYVIDELKNPNSEVLSLELVEKLVYHICISKDPGAILVFLPGMMDISALNKMMLQHNRYPRNRFVIYPLHSRMPTVDQRMIFKEPPEGVRKIIIATSIAETSITIEDVVYVIDCGKIKLSKFDVAENITTLNVDWVSLANAKQRRGRAGRVKPGYCYHLYSKGREMAFTEYPLPEMLCTRLEEVILRIKILQLGKVRPFLASVMDPPDMKAIDLSLDLLRKMNALDDDEHLTPLGYHLAQLPLDPRIGKMIIWAALFSCVDPVFAIAASLTFKDAFYCPLEKEKEAMEKKLELSSGQYSDHIALAEALKRFEYEYKIRNAFSFCHKYFLSLNTLKLLSEMKHQFAQYLYEMKFLGNDNPNDEFANRNSYNMYLIKAIVCAGLYPNIATINCVIPNGVIAWTPEDGRVQLLPSSVNARMSNFPSPFLTYFRKQRSTAIYLHDSSCVTAPILLFATAENVIRKEKGKYTIILNTSKTYNCDFETGQIIQRLLRSLSNLLEYKISHPGTICWREPEGQILNAVIELVSQKDEDMGFVHLIKHKGTHNSGT